MKQKILFLCNHNSARSQMAEGFINKLLKEKYVAFSAGIESTFLNPYAIEAMKEVGIDISHQHSKSIYEFRNHKLDFVITVCDNARETCPFFPASHN